MVCPPTPTNSATVPSTSSAVSTPAVRYSTGLGWTLNAFTRSNGNTGTGEKSRWRAARRAVLTTTPSPGWATSSSSTRATIEELTFLEPVEVARLVEAAVGGDYRTLDRALYVTAAYTGLRQGELRGLRWEHIDFGRSIVHVLENVTRGRRSSPKGKRRRS